MLFTEIQDKNVINVIDGSCIGYISDLELEPNTGQIYAIYVQETTNILNVFSRHDKIVLGWDQIVKIGEDVIIVNYPYKNTD